MERALVVVVAVLAAALEMVALLKLNPPWQRKQDSGSLKKRTSPRFADSEMA